MRLKSLSIKNYKCLKDVTLTDLPPFCAFIGANGTGKSTLFDALEFVRDVLERGPEAALELRDGYDEIVSAGSQDSLQFHLTFCDASSEFDYSLYIRGALGNFSIGESIRAHGRNLFDRTGIATVDIGSPSTLLFKVHDLVAGNELSQSAALGDFFKDFAISNPSIPDIRRALTSKHSPRLSPTGDNLHRVALALYQQQSAAFAAIQECMSRLVPGLDRIEVKETEDKRVILKFGDGAFKDPFLDRNVSDGTMKLFAYLVMLHAPEAYSLLCIEEPENYLYPTIQQELAEEFRAYTARGGQVFVSTHSPDFLNALNVDEVFWLVKENGFTKVVRAKDDPQVVEYMEHGDRMGWLWKEGLFKGAHP